MLLDKFQYLPGDAGVAANITTISFPVAQLFHLCILGWHDANGDLRRLAQVRAVERNRRNRPTSQSLPGFLAQALEETIFHHIAHSATVSFTIDLFDPPGCRESPLRMQFPGRRGACPANRLWRHPRGLPRAAHRLPVMFLLPWAVNQLRLVGVNGPYSVSLSPANEPEPPLICAARNLKNSDDGQSAF
jgi:hypothetical protein